MCAWRLPERRTEPPEPKAVHICEYCGEDICEGDDIVTFGNDVFHYDCFIDNAATLLLEKYGAVVGIAEKDDGYDG